MKINYIIFFSLAAISEQAHAGKILDAIMGVNQEHLQQVYNDQYMKNVEAYNALNDANAARDERMRIETEIAVKVQLIDMWKQMGLSDEEAKGVASSFVINDELFSHIARARREGFKVTLDAAKMAYQNRQYLLANQLLVAATRDGIPQP